MFLFVYWGGSTSNVRPLSYLFHLIILYIISYTIIHVLSPYLSLSSSKLNLVLPLSLSEWLFSPKQSPVLPSLLWTSIDSRRIRSIFVHVHVPDPVPQVPPKVLVFTPVPLRSLSLWLSSPVPITFTPVSNTPGKLKMRLTLPLSCRWYKVCSLLHEKMFIRLWWFVYFNRGNNLFRWRWSRVLIFERFLVSRYFTL